MLKSNIPSHFGGNFQSELEANKNLNDQIDNIVDIRYD